MPGLYVTAQAAEPQYTEFEELNGKSIGMITGAAFEELVRSKIPGVKEILFFSSAPDMLAALKAGKVEAYLMNNAVGTLLVNMDSSVAIFPKALGDTAYGLAFKKNSKDRAVWQEAFDKIPRDFHEMNGSLEKFCKDQFMGRRQAMNCQLAVEELTVSFLLPAIERAGHAGHAGKGAFHLTLFASEEGAERKLMIDCAEFPQGKKLLEELLKNIPADDGSAHESPVAQEEKSANKATSAEPEKHAKAEDNAEAAKSTEKPKAAEKAGLTKAAEFAKSFKAKAGSMEAASAAILANVLRRLPDEGKDTVVFRIQ